MCQHTNLGQCCCTLDPDSGQQSRATKPRYVVSSDSYVVQSSFQWRGPSQRSGISLHEARLLVYFEVRRLSIGYFMRDTPGHQHKRIWQTLCRICSSYFENPTVVPQFTIKRSEHEYHPKVRLCVHWVGLSVRMRLRGELRFACPYVPAPRCCKWDVFNTYSVVQQYPGGIWAAARGVTLRSLDALMACLYPEYLSPSRKPRGTDSSARPRLPLCLPPPMVVASVSNGGG